jgi:DNA-binding PadR family transcriptional regulator
MLERMDRGGAYQHETSATRSPLAWALLGLIIERPSYGYELVQRFTRTYGDMITLSGAKRIYVSLDLLKGPGLIEEVSDPGSHATTARRPRPHYRATEAGVHAYEDWLLTQMQEERHRSRLFARQLAMLEPNAALEVLDEYEREWLTAAGEVTPAETTREALAERLLEGEEQTTLEVRIAWIEFARNELRTLLAEGATET